jgi:hypothetical protein
VNGPFGPFGYQGNFLTRYQNMYRPSESTAAMNPTSFECFLSVRAARLGYATHSHDTHERPGGGMSANLARNATSRTEHEKDGVFNASPVRVWWLALGSGAEDHLNQSGHATRLWKA